MGRAFERRFQVRWGDMDGNAHMKNTAYLDISADVRMMYFEEHGFSMREFERLRIGPVILRDELDYHKEMRLLEPLRVTLQIEGLSADAARFRMRNDFFREDGRLVARVTSLGGWLDLETRRLVAPPEAIAKATREIEAAEGFREIEPRAQS